MKDIVIDTDRNRLDIDFIHAFVSDSYWAKDRNKKTVMTCADNSLNFGVYLHNRQIGYARVVTDFAQFAYIMDLFIVEHHRSKGYSKELMAFILGFDKLQEVKVWRLATSDAHGLYRKFGFTESPRPENLMELIRE